MVIEFLRPSEVIERTKMPKTTLYERASKGEFPKPLKMGPRASFWPAHEVEAWQRALIAGVDKERLCMLVSELEASRKGEAA